MSIEIQQGQITVFFGCGGGMEDGAVISGTTERRIGSKEELRPIRSVWTGTISWCSRPRTRIV